MAHIDYFLFPLSPFTYLAGSGLEDVAKKHGATLTYKPFDLMAVFGRTGGTALPDRHPSRLAYRAQELVRIAKMNGMEINIKPTYWPTNPAPAAYAITAAQAAGGGDLGGFVQSLLKACFAEQRNIAEDEVISACLEAHGFDKGLAAQDMLQGASTYSSNTEEAVRRGVFGAPSYLIEDQVFWGQDRLSHLDAYLSGKL